MVRGDGMVQKALKYVEGILLNVFLNLLKNIVMFRTQRVYRLTPLHRMARVFMAKLREGNISQQERDKFEKNFLEYKNKLYGF